LEEAWRRLGRRDALLGVVCALLGAGVVLVGAGDYHRALAAARAQEDAGVTVFTVEWSGGEVDPPVDPAACRRMAASDSVVASGPAPGEDIWLSARWLPSGLAVPVWDVSVEALRVWWPQAPAGGGLFAGPDLAEHLGIGPGAAVSLDGQVVRVAGVLPQAVLPRVWRANLIRTVPAFEARLAGVCWYRVARPALGEALLLAAAAFPDAGHLVTPYLRLDPLSVRPGAVLREGQSGWVWAAGLGVGVAMEALMALAARRESAIYRATGTRWGDMALMAAARAVIPVACGVLGAGAALAGAAWFGEVTASGQALRFVAQPALMYVAGLLAALPWVTLACSAGAVAERVAD
jgi:hypothetical protein